MKKYFIDDGSKKFSVIANHVPSNPSYVKVMEIPNELSSEDVRWLEVQVINEQEQLVVNQKTKTDLQTADSIDATNEAWTDLRSLRDSKLTRCDWTQMPDAPLSNQQKANWQTYRQELRDLPANTQDPTNPTWPQEPS